MNISGRNFTRAELEQRIGNLNQLGGTRHVLLNEGAAKGVAAIEVDTGSGLSFTVLPDRGMDISRASYKGINLVYQTPNGEVHPAFYNSSGAEWLRTFFGGLLTTCGLTYLGSPGSDQGVELGLHGRYSAIPAKRVQDRSHWDEDIYIIELLGTVEESALFGDSLVLERTIRAETGSRVLLIQDQVQNVGYTTSPFTILYHINAGFPLLDEDSRLVLTASETESVDEESAAALADFSRFSTPVPGFKEQNFLHTMTTAPDGMACAAMLNYGLNGGLGLCVRFDSDSLPYLNQWKMLGRRDYVVGIEPCNAPCDNRSMLRKKGLLPYLEPGEKRLLTVEISILDGVEELNACARQCGMPVPYL